MKAEMDPLSIKFAALADPTRRAILARLVLGETSVTELAEPFAMSMPAVSKHLKVLEHAGLVTRGRAAQWRPCKIEPAALKPLDEVKDKAIADWTADETHKRLLALAQEQIAELDNGATLDKLGLVTTHLDDFARDGFVQDTDPAVGKEVFAMTAGDHKVVDAGGKVYLLSLDSVTPADMSSEAVRTLRDKIRASLSQSTGRDLFDAFTGTPKIDRPDRAALSDNPLAIPGMRF